MYVEVDSRMQSCIILLYGCSTAPSENVWHLRMKKRISSFYLTSIALYHGMSAMQVKCQVVHRADFSTFRYYLRKAILN